MFHSPFTRMGINAWLRQSIVGGGGNTPLCNELRQARGLELNPSGHTGHNAARHNVSCTLAITRWRRQSWDSWWVEHTGQLAIPGCWGQWKTLSKQRGGRWRSGSAGRALAAKSQGLTQTVNGEKWFSHVYLHIYKATDSPIYMD